jgi:hypothetical protein
VKNIGDYFIFGKVTRLGWTNQLKNEQPKSAGKLISIKRVKVILEIKRPIFGEVRGDQGNFCFDHSPPIQYF